MSQTYAPRQLVWIAVGVFMAALQRLQDSEILESFELKNDFVYVTRGRSRAIRKS